MSIVVVGSVAYDGVETPHGKVERMLGGSCTYIALSASYFSPVKIVGVVGDDFAQEDTDLLALAFFERSPNRTDPRVLQNLCTCIQRNRIRQRPWQIGEHPVFRELLLAALEGEPQVLDGLLNLLEALPGLLPPSLLKTVLGKLRELARDPNNGLDPTRLDALD